MPSMIARAMVIALLSAASSHGQAEPATDATPPAADSERGRGDEVKTLKERLSDKPSDEQRVDNCGVPEDRRGAKLRPDCPPGRARLSAKPPLSSAGR